MRVLNDLAPAATRTALRRGRGRRRFFCPLVVACACALSAAATGGCGGGAPARPPTAAPRPAVVPEGPQLEDRGWGVLRSPALGLKLALPEARSWLEPQGPAAEGKGWELRHEPTGSTLSVRRWRASRLPRLDACEAELRERTPDLASMDETNLIAERQLQVPEGFVTRITLLTLPSVGTQLRGQALAVGASVDRPGRIELRIFSAEPLVARARDPRCG